MNEVKTGTGTSPLYQPSPEVKTAAKEGHIAKIGKLEHKIEHLKAEKGAAKGIQRLWNFLGISHTARQLVAKQHKLSQHSAMLEKLGGANQTSPGTTPLTKDNMETEVAKLHTLIAKTEKTLKNIGRQLNEASDPMGTSFDWNKAKALSEKYQQVSTELSELKNYEAGLKAKVKSDTPKTEETKDTEPLPEVKSKVSPITAKLKAVVDKICNALGIINKKELGEKVANFSQTDEFSEAHLKDDTRSGKPLFGMAKEIKDLKINKLTQSLARLHTVKMKVTIDGQTVLQSGTGKTSVGDNVGKLLTAINKSMGLGDEEAQKKAESRVSVLEQFGPKQSECDPLETTDTAGNPVSDNKDVLALKLVTKECALIGIIPLSAQINMYSNNNNIDPPISVRGNFDQAESIDITRTETGFKAVHTFEVPIMQEGKQIATVTLKMTSHLDETTGKLTGSSERSNLRFTEGVSLKTQQHVLNALSGQLPTELP